MPVLNALIAAGAPLEAVIPSGEPFPGCTALVMAVHGQHLQVIDALVAAGAEIDSTGAKCGVETMGGTSRGFIGSGFSALMTAVKLGHVDTVSSLLRHVASPHQGLPEWRADEGHPQTSPLALAKRNQDAEIQRMLAGATTLKLEPEPEPEPEQTQAIDGAAGW